MKDDLDGIVVELDDSLMSEGLSSSLACASPTQIGTDGDVQTSDGKTSTASAGILQVTCI